MEALAASVADSGGGILGLTRATSRGEIARATLDSVAYQTYDLLDAMAADGLRPETLKVDGGMAQNDLWQDSDGICKSPAGAMPCGA